MNCKYCDAALPIGSNPCREFCNDAHRQAYWRAQHQADQSAVLLAELEQLRAQVRDQAQGQTFTKMLSELVELRAKVADQVQEIEELRSRLDIETRYLSDTKPYYFKSWLKKQPGSPLVTKMFADPSETSPWQ